MTFLSVKYDLSQKTKIENPVEVEVVFKVESVGEPGYPACYWPTDKNGSTNFFRSSFLTNTSFTDELIWSILGIFFKIPPYRCTCSFT